MLFCIFKLLSYFELFEQQKCIQNSVEHLRWSFLRRKCFQLLTIFIKGSTLDIRLGFEYASE